MLSKTNQDLPVEVRTRLSEAAQHLYRVAFNSNDSIVRRSVEGSQVAASAVKMLLAREASLVSASDDHFKAA